MNNEENKISDIENYLDCQEKGIINQQAERFINSDEGEKLINLLSFEALMSLGDKFNENVEDKTYILDDLYARIDEDKKKKTVSLVIDKTTSLLKSIKNYSKELIISSIDKYKEHNLGNFNLSFTSADFAFDRDIETSDDFSEDIAVLQKEVDLESGCKIILKIEEPINNLKYSLFLKANDSEKMLLDNIVKVSYKDKNNNYSENPVNNLSEVSLYFDGKPEFNSDYVAKKFREKNSDLLNFEFENELVYCFKIDN